MFSANNTLIGLLREEKRKRYLILLGNVTDAYYRMSTSTDERYIKLQRERCDSWLEEMTNIIMSLDNK